MDLMLEMGVNAMRLAHYQQDTGIRKIGRQKDAVISRSQNKNHFSIGKYSNASWVLNW